LNRMDDNTILCQLEELAGRLGINIRYASLDTDGLRHMGGFCQIKGQDCVIINQKATPREKIHIFIDALQRHDLSEIYILPSLREMLDGKSGQ